MSGSIVLDELAAGPRLTVVAGHGLTLDRSSLEPLLAALADDGHRVLAWELPGHGRAAECTTAWSVDSLGRELHAALRATEIGPVALVGVSLGGYVSLAAAASAPGGGPDNVAALGLIGCSGLPAPAVDAVRLARLATWAVSGELDAEDARAMAVAELGPDHRGTPALAQRWRSDRSCGRRFLPGYLALMGRPDPVVGCADLTGTPAIVVRGSADPWVARQEADRLGGLLGAEVLHVDGASHQPQLTHPGAVVPRIRALVRRAEESTRWLRERNGPETHRP